MRVIDDDRLAVDPGQLVRELRQSKAKKFQQHETEDKSLSSAKPFDPRADPAKNGRAEQGEPQYEQGHFRQFGQERARRGVRSERQKYRDKFCDKHNDENCAGGTEIR